MVAMCVSVHASSYEDVTNGKFVKYISYCESDEKARLADRRISDEKNLEEEVAVENYDKKRKEEKRRRRRKINNKNLMSLRVLILFVGHLGSFQFSEKNGKKKQKIQIIFK